MKKEDYEKAGSRYSRTIENDSFVVTNQIRSVITTLKLEDTIEKIIERRVHEELLKSRSQQLDMER